jgi:hypothetical protein
MLYTARSISLHYQSRRRPVVLVRPTQQIIRHQPLLLHPLHPHFHSLLFKGLPIGGANVLLPAGLPGSTPDATDAELGEFFNCPILDCLPAMGSSYQSIKSRK